ncbi:MAG: DNA replication and repair protein RecF [bacterium]|nr:DNA replication and repair protein RecF [bacterium]
MQIRSARISGFRNLQETRFDFSSRVNVVVGRNGEGKTNLLEALNYFALGRSHRGARNDELIAFDAEALHVELGVVEESGAELACEYGLGRNNGRRFRLDGEALRRRADLVGRLATVFFNPDSIRLVRGSPQRRRHFVDQGIAEIDPSYLVHLTAFQRALKQKTGLLRDVRHGAVDGRRIRDDLEAWNREIATHAAVVCRERGAYANLMTPFADAAHRELAGDEETLRVVYRPRLETAAARVFTEDDAGAPGNPLETPSRTPSEGNPPEAEKPGEIGSLEQDIFKELSYIVGSEIQRGRPLNGPQMDDFEVRLSGSPDEGGEAPGLDLRTYGSQGETRSAAIALILARSDVLHRRRQVRPVLFLDDIFSELDRERTRRLQNMAIRAHQVFVATARPDDLGDWRPADLCAWRVDGGAFTQVKDPTAPL